MSSDPVLTNLYDNICIRRLNTFCRLSRIFLQSSLERLSTELSHRGYRTTSISSALSSNTIDDLPADSRLMIQIFFIVKTRVIPEAENLGTKTGTDSKVILDTRTRIARLLLHFTLLRQEYEIPNKDIFGDADELVQHVNWAVQVIAGWYRAGSALPWRSVLEMTLRQLVCISFVYVYISSCDAIFFQIKEGWKTSLPILLSLLKHIPDDIKKSLFSFLLPVLNDVRTLYTFECDATDIFFKHLVDDLPPYPYSELSILLSTLSLSWPPLFYKPLFACSASDKEVIVVNHLCTIQVHAKYVSDYWTRDPEMFCVALLSDIGMTDSDLGSKDGNWGIARLGQLVLLVELIGKLQILRHERDASVSARIFLSFLK